MVAASSLVVVWSLCRVVVALRASVMVGFVDREK